MLKYSSLVLLIAVAAFWSQVDAKPYASVAHGLAKRGADHVGKFESGEEIAVTLLAGLLLLKTETSAEMETLMKKYQDAYETKNWKNLDEFATYLANTYQEVTGRRIDDKIDSDELLEDSDES